jgi:hypothetical protein
MVLLLSAVPRAQAGTFCTNVSLAPYGQGGDRCWGPSLLNLNYGDVHTQERAGCVAIADGSNNLLTQWKCGAAGSWPGFSAWASIQPGGYGSNQKAVIRNNNLSSWGKFGGGYNCYGGC